MMSVHPRVVWACSMCALALGEVMFAHAVSTPPVDIQDILAQHSSVAAIDDPEPSRKS